MTTTSTKRLPAGWATATLPELIAPDGLLTDGDWVETKDQDPGGAVRLTQLADVGDGVFRDRSHRFLTGERADELNCTYLVAGDVLIARMPDPLGRACLFPGSSRQCVTVVDVCIARPGGDTVEPKWMMHFINAPASRLAIEALQKGSTRKRISKANLCTIPIPVPPRREQSRIAAAIDSHTSRLDETVALLERVQRNLNRYRASVLKAAVEGRLVPTEAELARAEKRGYETACARVSATVAPPRPARWKTRTKDVVVGHGALSVGDPHAALPEGWTRSPLVDVARMESGHTPSRARPEWWGGEVPWIGIADARENDGKVICKTLQHTNAGGLANSAARLLPAGTVCVSRTASVGYVVVMGHDMATSQDFVNWIPTAAVTSDWLRVVFSADREALRRFGKGTVHKTIYFPEWLSVHVAIPPMQEQLRIVAEVDKLLSDAETIGATVAISIERCSRLRHSILKWAFEGKLVDQDPNDEPADALLARIRAAQLPDAPVPAQSAPRRRKRKA